MYACLDETCADFSRACGRRIGHLLFASLPHHPGIRDLVTPVLCRSCEVWHHYWQHQALRLKEGWEEGTTIFVPTSRPKSLCGHSAHRPGVVARGIYLLRYVSTLKATLITNAKTMVLNTKESTEWAQTRFRIELLDTSTSAPWNEVPIMKEK
jgi:hypothetical protein